MELREGMLGVVVVALALTAALFVSYGAGITGVENEVTKYQYLADVSGMFEYDKTPTYIEFDPSTNYVGYYSEDTGDYFPVDDIGYELSNRTNNYKVNLAPIRNDTLDNVDFSGLTEQDIPTLDHSLTMIQYHTQTWNTENNGTYTITPKTTTLAKLIEEMDYGDNQIIKIASPNSLDVDISGATISNPVSTGWLMFFPSSWVSVTGGNNGYVLHLATKEVYDVWQWPSYVNPNLTIHMPSLSCSINLGTSLVTLYYDNDFKTSVGSFNLDSVSIAYSSVTNQFFPDSLVLDDEGDVTLQIFPPNEYLDPNYGVVMKDD